MVSKKEVKDSSYKGLTEAEAKKKLKQNGKNEIKKGKKKGPLRIFLSQFTSPLIILLILAAIISYSVGFLQDGKSHYIDTILIGGIVLISGIVGFFQEYKAEKSIEALQKMSTPKAIVIRGGVKKEISILDLVPEDIISLSSGDIVPADAKILEESNLKIDESIITGESESVDKNKGKEIYKNSSVYIGRAIALVEKTGMETKVGQIADQLQNMEDTDSSFQTEIRNLSKKLIVGISFIILIIAFVSAFKYSLIQSMLIAISLAVAAVPEGLPAAVTSVLAIGSRVMAKQNSLIRKLSVTESIGSIDVICSDKTGTLTKNEMSVTNVFTNKELKNVQNPKKNLTLNHLLLCSTLCNDVEKSGEDYLGDQTEVALKRFADQFYSKKDIQSYKRLNEIPFTSERKMMAVHFTNKKGKNEEITYAKGAPEVILKKCTRIMENGRITHLTEKKKKELLEQNKKYASQGLRVLAFSFKKSKSKKHMEKNLVFLGLEAMRDPPREAVPKAIKDCHNAGIRVVMITGDNSRTAEAIGKEVGLNSNGVLTGEEIEKLNDNELTKKINTGCNIFARVSPFHKLRILELLEKENRVAMTGDGVNDALALKKADVGIAMGIRGTEVSKQASDIILLDDNFASIRNAVKEGRRIFSNIRNFVNFLLTSNMAEILVIFLATVFLTLKVPILLPAQILWINFLTDLFPALALGLDPAKKDIMKEFPRGKNEKILNREMFEFIAIIGTIMTIILFSIFFISKALVNVETARTAVFTGFVIYELVIIGVIRKKHALSWKSNIWLIVALAFSLLLQALAVYTSLGQKVFEIVPIYDLRILGIILSGALIGYWSSLKVYKLLDLLNSNNKQDD